MDELNKELKPEDIGLTSKEAATVTEATDCAVEEKTDQNATQGKKKRGFKSFVSKIIPSKRKLIQLYAALLFNANLKGFKNGRIYQGSVKTVCAPGLNCYSCPGASAACPLGSMQTALTGADKSAFFYAFGIVLRLAMPIRTYSGAILQNQNP